MWETLRNVWRVPELRKKVLYTFFMLLVFRLVSIIPVPGVNSEAIGAAMASYDILSLMNMMTGSALSQMTIMAMGISPYINASIIMQLLCIAIPALEKLQKEGGEEGKKKINQITRYVTVALAALQAIGLISAFPVGLEAGYNNFFGKLFIGIVMAGGTALAMWIGERITKNGIGNGVSLLIFSGIVINLFNSFLGNIVGLFNGGSTIWNLLIMIVSILVILVVVTIVDMSERRISVQYAKRVVGRKMYGGQSTHIPMKLLSVGVLPLIFAYSFMAFPGTIITIFWPHSGAAAWWEQNMTSTFEYGIPFGYLIVTTLLIVAFTYFYASISFNPQDIAKNIQQQGGHIPGIRTGTKTVDYLARTSKRLCLFAALFLAVMNIIATLLTGFFSIPLGASSVLIAVSVAIETVRQVESQLVMRNYKGFLG